MDDDGKDVDWGVKFHFASVPVDDDDVKRVEAEWVEIRASRVPGDSFFRQDDWLEMEFIAVSVPVDKDDIKAWTLKSAVALVPMESDKCVDLS